LLELNPETVPVLPVIPETVFPEVVKSGLVSQIIDTDEYDPSKLNDAEEMVFEDIVAVVIIGNVVIEQSEKEPAIPVALYDIIRK
jgi:hypothetical protein